MAMLVRLVQLGGCHLVVVSIASLSKPSHSRKLPGQSVPDCAPEEEPEDDPPLEPDPDDDEPPDGPLLDPEAEESRDPELLPEEELPPLLLEPSLLLLSAS
jgi:hypothetical protein